MVAATNGTRAPNHAHNGHSGLATTAASPNVAQAPYPAQTKTAAGEVNGIYTEVMSVGFTDKIVITISQGGRVGHWIHVPLDIDAPVPLSFRHDEDEENEPRSELLPLSHLTATTVLGGGIAARDTVGQLYATQIASAIATRNPGERRLVVVGLGLEKVDTSRETFLDVLDLALKCI